MAYIDRNGVKKPSGALYVNREKTKDSSPDYTGDVELDKETVDSILAQRNKGVDMPIIALAGWRKEGNKGTFISMKAEKKRVAETNPEPESTGDEIPF